MKKNSVVCVAAVLLVASMATANTVWDPAGNPDPNVIVDGSANWSDTANWANGLPVENGDGSQGNDPKAVFNVLGAPECQLTDIQSIGTLVMGDGGDAAQNNVLRIMDGGSLTSGATSGWDAIGYNRPATLIVEEGGSYHANAHLWWGLNDGAVGTVIINGGTVIGADAIDLGRNGNAVCSVYINSGLLQARYISRDGIGLGSLMDIKFGTWKILGNRLSKINEILAYDPPRLIAFGGAGTLNVELIDGDTYITANSPMEPFPAYESLIADGSVELSWTNMASDNGIDAVYVDVWFGTDPESLSLVPGLSGVADANSVTVDAPVIDLPPTTYYWKVNSYIYGEDMVGDANMIEGDVFRFDVTNDFAPTVEIHTPDTLTWANEPIQLEATISDTGDSAVHIEWTSSDPNTKFIDPLTLLEDPTVEDPIVTVDYGAGEVTLTVTVWDDYNPETDLATMVLDVAANACEATRDGAGMAAQYPMDTNNDCVLNLADLAIVAADWLTDYALLAPRAIP